MKVSVAMAAYNGEKYISEQIDSILQQLDVDDEIVISYDTSQDNTLSIIQNYTTDKRVRLLYNKVPGIFGNFNNAIKHCNGDIIFISDQDDIWVSNKISFIRDVFNTKDVDMVIHNGVHINESGKIISKSFFEEYGISLNKLKNFIMPRYSGCCIAFNKKMKNYIVPIPQNVGAYDHWVGMMGEYFGKIYLCKEILIYHRLHGDNATPVRRRDLRTIVMARTNIFIELIKRKAKCRNV